MTEVVNQITGEVFESGFTGELNKNNPRLSKRGREVLSQKPAGIPLQNRIPETMREKWARFHVGMQIMKQEGYNSAMKRDFFETEEEFNDFDIEDNPFDTGNGMAEDFDKLSPEVGKMKSAMLTEEARAVAAARPENFPAEAAKEGKTSNPTGLELTSLEKQIIASYRQANKTSSTEQS